MSELEILLQLQDQDLELDRLRLEIDRIEERKQLSQAKSSIDLIDAKLDEIFRFKKEFSKKLKELDTEIEKVSARISRLEDQIRSGQVPNVKDQVAVMHEMDQLSSVKNQAEENMLEIMESVEKLDLQARELESQKLPITNTVAELESQIQVKVQALEQEINSHLPNRESIYSTLTTALRSKYETLRGKLGGMAVAQILDGKCSGCHLTIPTTEKEKIIHSTGESISNCEQCGRMLIYLPQSGTE